MKKNIPFLRPNDCIGITAPARKISIEEIQPALHFFQNEGFRVVLGEHLFDDNNQFAGTDQARAQDMQSFINDPDIRAIVCARGGYGSVRIIDKIDFSPLFDHPKWICGYSDVTVFHSHLNCLQIPTLHCTMPINIHEHDIENLNNKTCLQFLRGELLAYHIKPHPFNRSGNAQATIVGGNLSILYSLLGSSSDIDTTGKILFIEDLDEYLYHIDRMMMALKRAGKLDHLAGLLVGSMSDMHDNTIPFGETAEEIIARCCQEYDYPICFHFPAGHTDENVAIPFGIECSLTVPSSGSPCLLVPYPHEKN